MKIFIHSKISNINGNRDVTKECLGLRFYLAATRGQKINFNNMRGKFLATFLNSPGLFQTLVTALTIPVHCKCDKERASERKHERDQSSTRLVDNRMTRAGN